MGQAAWIYEKFQAWTDNGGAPEDALTRDEMLDVITLCWLTETAASSARIYLENATVIGSPPVVEIPVGCSIFPLEIVPAPRSWAEPVYPNLIHWNELDRGGHFAARPRDASVVVINHPIASPRPSMMCTGLPVYIGVNAAESFPRPSRLQARPHHGLSLDRDVLRAALLPGRPRFPLGSAVDVTEPRAQHLGLLASARSAGAGRFCRLRLFN